MFSLNSFPSRRGRPSAQSFGYGGPARFEHHGHDERQRHHLPRAFGRSGDYFDAAIVDEHLNRFGDAYDVEVDFRDHFDAVPYHDRAPSARQHRRLGSSYYNNGFRAEDEQDFAEYHGNQDSGLLSREERRQIAQEARIQVEAERRHAAAVEQARERALEEERARGRALALERERQRALALERERQRERQLALEHERRRAVQAAERQAHHRALAAPDSARRASAVRSQQAAPSVSPAHLIIRLLDSANQTNAATRHVRLAPTLPAPRLVRQCQPKPTEPAPAAPAFDEEKLAGDFMNFLRNIIGGEEQHTAAPAPVTSLSKQATGSKQVRFDTPTAAAAVASSPSAGNSNSSTPTPASAPRQYTYAVPAAQQTLNNVGELFKAIAGGASHTGNEDENLFTAIARSMDPSSQVPTHNPAPSKPASSSNPASDLEEAIRRSLDRSHDHQATPEDVVDRKQKSRSPSPARSDVSHHSTESLHTIDTIETAFHHLADSFTFPRSADITFQPTSSTNLAYTPLTAPVRAHENALTSLLTKLDAIQSEGDESVRARRKALVMKIEATLDQLAKDIRAVWDAQNPQAEETEVVVAEPEKEQLSHGYDFVEPPVSFVTPKVDQSSEEPSTELSDAVVELPVEEDVHKVEVESADQETQTAVEPESEAVPVTDPSAPAIEAVTPVSHTFPPSLPNKDALDFLASLNSKNDSAKTSTNTDEPVENTSPSQAHSDFEMVSDEE